MILDTIVPPAPKTWINTTPWTAALTIDLIRLWNDGLSASAIGAAIGMTRNAVMGKKTRLGLSDRRTGETKTRSIKLRIERKPRAPRLARVPISGLEPSEEFRCDLMGLTDAKCKFPYGDGPFLFCGHPATDEEKRPYCDFHHQVCRVKYIQPDRRAA